MPDNTSPQRDYTKLFNGAAIAGAVAALGATAAGLMTGSFAAPWVLAATPALSVLWYLMRSNPPKPEQIFFPAMMVLDGIKSEDQQPITMPLWQKILGLSAPFLLAAGLAQPQWKPEAIIEGSGPDMLVVDNGWAAAKTWPSLMVEANKMMDRAERGKRPVIILRTASSERSGAIEIAGPVDVKTARAVLKEMKPEPWPVDRQAALTTLQLIKLDKVNSILWLSDGLDDKAMAPLVTELRHLGKLTVVKDPVGTGACLLVPPEAGEASLSVTVRCREAPKNDIVVSAYDEKGHPFTPTKAQFKNGETQAKITFGLLLEISNGVDYIKINDDHNAGSIVMLDERWKRRPVGLIKEGVDDPAQSYLGESYYIDHALRPFVDLHTGNVADLLKNKMAAVIATDNVSLSDSDRADLDRFTREGGTLLRFAGPHLAEEDHKQDPLLPVHLRSGSRGLDNLSGQADKKSGRILPFDPGSPFHDLVIPNNVTINRQILAQPEPGLDQKVWARLADGSPLVTAEQRGKGWVVLIHTAARTDWSDFVLSSLFIDMQRAIVAHSQSVSGGQQDGESFSLLPQKMLDGFGQFRMPSPIVGPLTSEILQSKQVGPKNPPGIYGKEGLMVAYNLAGAVPELKPFGPMPADVSVRDYDPGKGQSNLEGYVLGTGLSLLLADLLLLQAQRGAFSRLSRRRKDQGLDTSPIV